jgi:hypothetical protein
VRELLHGIELRVKEYDTRNTTLWIVENMIN